MNKSVLRRLVIAFLIVGTCGFSVAGPVSPDPNDPVSIPIPKPDAIGINPFCAGNPGVCTQPRP